VSGGVFAEEGHPAACPWCGRSPIRGILPSPDGNRWYRCVACATSFFLRVASRHDDRHPHASLGQAAGFAKSSS
jgi:formate dehydrogenase maturation protein FdhE